MIRDRKVAAGLAAVTGYHLASLRHLYQQMLNGEVEDTAEAALNLLGPAIVAIERLGVAARSET